MLSTLQGKAIMYFANLNTLKYYGSYYVFDEGFFAMIVLAVINVLLMG